MSGFRAKDADRDRYVDIIESAYVDGQLGEQDRELRVGRALTAATLDELDALTRDLQNRPLPVMVRSAPVTPAPAPVQRAMLEPWPVKPKDRTPARAVGFVAAAIFAVAVYSMASAEQPIEELDYSRDSSYAAGSASAPGYTLTAPGLQRFLRRYEAKFQTTQVFEVAIFSDRVVVQVPGADAPRRSAQWSWDGIWRREEPSRPVDRPTSPVDLGTLDVSRLFDSIDVAESDLGVSDAEVQRVVVRRAPDGQASVTIHVRNGFADSALLETTLEGARIRAVPHAG